MPVQVFPVHLQEVTTSRWPCLGSSPACLPQGHNFSSLPVLSLSNTKPQQCNGGKLQGCVQQIGLGVMSCPSSPHPFLPARLQAVNAKAGSQGVSLLFPKCRPFPVPDTGGMEGAGQVNFSGVTPTSLWWHVLPLGFATNRFTFNWGHWGVFKSLPILLPEVLSSQSARCPVLPASG